MLTTGDRLDVTRARWATERKTLYYFCRTNIWSENICKTISLQRWLLLYKMNIFRLSGDVCHLVAIIILFLKIWRSRSCAGNCAFVVTVISYWRTGMWRTGCRINLRVKSAWNTLNAQMTHNASAKAVNNVTRLLTRSFLLCLRGSWLQFLRKFFRGSLRNSRSSFGVYESGYSHVLWSLLLCISGISGKSQVLFALVFTTRYLDLFTAFISIYNTVMKVKTMETHLRHIRGKIMLW